MKKFIKTLTKIRYGRLLALINFIISPAILIVATFEIYDINNYLIILLSSLGYATYIMITLKSISGLLDLYLE